MVAERENIQVTEEKELLQQRTRGSRNEMEIVFDAVSCNESFARVAVAAFITHLNPTLEELADIKTAVSEAVTNAIIHGYENSVRLYEAWGERSGVQHYPSGKGKMHCILENDTFSIEITDQEKASRMWKSHGTVIYHEAGTGTVRHGVCLYGSLHGRAGGRETSRQGHKGTYVEENALRRLDRKRGLRHGRSISTHRKSHRVEIKKQEKY